MFFDFWLLRWLLDWVTYVECTVILVAIAKPMKFKIPFVAR